MQRFRLPSTAVSALSGGLVLALAGSLAAVRPGVSAHPVAAAERNVEPAGSLEPAGCCGPVTPAGIHLREVLDGMDVDHLWLDHFHVNWETGHTDRPPGYDGPDTHSHCSDFAAAVGQRLGVYMLRPPEHPQQLLASAQGKWFETPAARDQGWTPVASFREAQSLANRGHLVVLSFVSPDPHRPGHIAIVRPTVKTDQALTSEGPETTQAGTFNFTDGNAKHSFAMHPGAWPDGIRMYSHKTGAEAGQTAPR
jgi:hypothetical protein